MYSIGENKITEKIYEELILINYKDKSVRRIVEKVMEYYSLVGAMHTEYLINTIRDILSRSVNPTKGFSNLNSWAFKGYNFLGRIDAVGNFGEQGKSIVYHYSQKDSIQEMYYKIEKIYPYLNSELKDILNKLQQGQIKLTGRFRLIRYYGKCYDFFENENKY